MIQKILTNLAYLYYPQNICAYKEKSKYYKSPEYKRLLEVIADFDSEKNRHFQKILMDEFEKKIILKDFEDFTLFHLQDRCFTYRLGVNENRKFYSINVYISLLIPYYIIEITEHKMDFLLSKEKIEELQNDSYETGKIKDLVIDIEKIIEKKLMYKKFPEVLLNIVIPNISFQDSEFGYFTMYNAFFNNVIIRNENNN